MKSFLVAAGFSLRWHRPLACDAQVKNLCHRLKEIVRRAHPTDNFSGQISFNNTTLLANAPGCKTLPEFSPASGALLTAKPGSPLLLGD
jgi:hypothetical protein